MTDKDDELDLALELRELADRFSEGWHEGIKIDASVIMLLAMAASQIEQARSAPVQEPPPECQTEAEKRAYAFGWWKALEYVKQNGVI